MKIMIMCLYMNNKLHVLDLFKFPVSFQIAIHSAETKGIAMSVFSNIMQP